MRKVTLDDIARETNLSRAAVGCALSNRAGNTRISEQTRKRVLEVAERLNYHSHTGARALRTSRFDNVGYFVAIKTPWDYAFTEIILHGLSEGAVKYGKNIVLVQLPSQSATDEIPKALRERCLDALIIFEGATFLPGFQAAAEASGIPIVYMNEKQDHNSIYIDDVETGLLMTQHLVERGFRRIAMLAPETPREHYSSHDRIAGYKQVMVQAGLEPDVQRMSSKSFQQDCERWLAAPDRPEAIFCVSDLWAVTLQQVLYRLRLRVPDELAICGCDGWHHAKWSTVPLTTAVIPFQHMAATAFEMAMQRVLDPAPLPSVVIRPTIRIAESTDRTI
jgi:DNA-binding LacI/PurR family transcriptional regulator